MQASLGFRPPRSISLVSDQNCKLVIHVASWLQTCQGQFGFRTVKHQARHIRRGARGCPCPASGDYRFDHRRGWQPSLEPLKVVSPACSVNISRQHLRLLCADCQVMPSTKMIRKTTALAESEGRPSSLVLVSQQNWLPTRWCAANVGRV